MNREEKIRMQQEEDARLRRLELMRESVKEVELQARYWKAMYETKYYTLEDSKLKDEYEKYFLDVQARAEQAAEQLEKLRELGVDESSVVSDETSNIIPGV